MSRNFAIGMGWIIPALLLSLALSAPAQETPEAQPDADEGAVFEQALQSKISIDFSGGLLSEFVGQIRDFQPSLNIVVTEPAAGQQLPEVRLVDVPLRGALSLLSTLSNSQVVVDFQFQSETYDANIVLISSPDVPQPSRSPEVRVFNVKQLLGASNREALLTALESGYQMLGTMVTPVDVKIHEATGLLFIKGTPEQLELAEAVIREIERGMDPMGPNDNSLHGSLPVPSEAPILNTTPVK